MLKYEPEQQTQNGVTDDKTLLIRVNKRHLVIVLASLLSFAVGYALGNINQPQAVAQRTQVQVAPTRATESTSGSPRLISADDDPFIGPSDAAITIVEFSDYQCPFCKRFREDTLDPLLAEYKGQLRFVYRDFPLSTLHPRAQIAAEAADCAQEQGKFWEMHDTLFAQQADWARAADVFQRFEQYATDLNLEVEPFLNCLKTGKYTPEVQQDLREGQRYGVNGTPAFFVNGQAISGAVPLQFFEQIIDQQQLASSN